MFVLFYVIVMCFFFFFFFSSRRRHTRLQGDWSSDVCSSDLVVRGAVDENDRHTGLDVRQQVPVTVRRRDDDQPIHPARAKGTDNLALASWVLAPGSGHEDGAVGEDHRLDRAREHRLEWLG